MRWLNKVIGKPKKAESNDQAVIIGLNGTSLADEVYDQYDTSTLEDNLTDMLGDAGKCDGTEHGESESRIFLYGSDAEAMFQLVKPVLLTYPLAASARVVIRFGPPGSPEREVFMP